MNFLESLGLVALGVILFIIIIKAESTGRVRIGGRLGCLPFIMIGMGIYYMGLSIWNGAVSLFTPTSSQPSIATVSPVVHPTLTPRAFRTPNIPLPTNSRDTSCFSWDQVSKSFVGQEICVYGVVYALYPTNETVTRIKFTSEKNTFFFSDVNGYYPDLRTGECVYAEEILRVYNNQIPYMDIDKLYECESWMK